MINLHVMTAAAAKVAGDLSQAQRDDLSKGQFALPSKKKYPIPDEAHARNALARAAQFASKGEQATIRAAVDKKFPGVKLTDASKPAQPTVKKAAGAKPQDVVRDVQGLELDTDEPFKQLLELGGHPSLPPDARKAILEAFLKHRSEAPVMSHENALEQAKNIRGGHGAAIGMLAGMPIGAVIGIIAHDKLGVPGMALGALGGTALGYGIGRATVGKDTANKNIENAKAHQEHAKSLLADPVMQERLLGHLAVEHLNNQFEALDRRYMDEDYGKYSFDMSVMARAAEAAIKSAAPHTVGLYPGLQQEMHVDAAAQLAGRTPGANQAYIQDLAHYYKTREATPAAQAAQQALTAAANRAPVSTPGAAMNVVKRTTPMMGSGNVLSQAAHIAGPQKVVAGAVQHGLPIAGTASVLDHLMHAGGAALGFAGKHAGLADRGYMHAAADKMKSKISPQDAMRYGLPAVYGGVSGAEQLPENKLVGALAGAGGAVGGGELGSRAGRHVARGMGAGPVGETFADLIGRVIGGSQGTNLAVRGARLLVT